ncbi:MAG: potassium channel family protein [Verrucomicrobia bacterium]|nr:potassium channel family protein [Verrucomicrobiota bacterium]
MASPPQPGAAAEQVGPFQFAILVLAVLSLATIAADSLLVLPKEISRLLNWVDLLACLAFLVDFCVRFRAAESKLAFMKWGWIDLLASVPNIEALRIGRLVRVLRVLRLLRGVRSLQRLLAMLFGARQGGGAASVGLMRFLVIVTGSVGILWCERVEGANIRTAEDAVWWSVTTVTTVGYGDRYPVTASGRVIAGALMVCGVGMFGALSGIVASLFLGQRSEQEAVLTEVKAMRAELAQLRRGEGRDPETGRGKDGEPRGPGP